MWVQSFLSIWTFSPFVTVVKRLFFLSPTSITIPVYLGEVIVPSAALILWKLICKNIMHLRRLADPTKVFFSSFLDSMQSYVIPKPNFDLHTRHSPTMATWPFYNYLVESKSWNHQRVHKHTHTKTKSCWKEINESLNLKFLVPISLNSKSNQG